MKKIILYVSVVFLMSLGGCALSPRTQSANTYMLNATMAASPKREHSYPVTLRVLSIQVSPWLDSRNIYYQFVSDSPSRILPYRDHFWLASPANMIQIQWVDSLLRSNQWQNVVGPDTNVVANYFLQMHLIELRQVFENLKKSKGVVVLKVDIIDPKTDKILAGKMFTKTEPAESADAQGGVLAIDKALRVLLPEINHWVAHRIGGRKSQQ